MSIHRSFFRPRAYAMQRAFHERRVAAAVLVALLLCLCSSAAAQTVDDELAMLRQHLGAPPAFTLETAVTNTAPAGDPLKVFITTGMDSAGANMAAEIAKWNKDHGSKYGRLEIVETMDAADVILARYRQLDRVTNTSSTQSRIVPVATWDPATQTMKTTPVARTNSISVAEVPAYAYILQKTATGAKVLRRYTSMATMTETQKSGTTLTDTLFAMLKNRGKH